MTDVNPLPNVSAGAQIGIGVKVWAGSQIREGSEIGENTTIGQYCYVGPGVKIGANCKIQNHALLYEPAEIGEGVFIGPRVTITNDVNPRAVNSQNKPKRAQEWLQQAAIVEPFASIGAGAILIGQVRIGSWALVGAGSVVTKDVKPFALVVGNPAAQIGWVGRDGFRLLSTGKLGEYACPVTGQIYSESQTGFLEPSFKTGSWE